jgi:hypothetical protein
MVPADRARPVPGWEEKVPVPLSPPRSRSPGLEGCQTGRSLQEKKKKKTRVVRPAGDLAAAELYLRKVEVDGRGCLVTHWPGLRPGD